MNSGFFPVPRRCVSAGVAVVLGCILFIYAVAFPRREIVTPGPLESDRLSHDPDHMAAE